LAVAKRTLRRDGPNLERELPGSNLLLNALRDYERSAIDSHLEFSRVQRGDVLFEPGQPVEFVTFPCDGTLTSLSIAMRDGRAVQTATVGREGAIGGVVSQGYLPAYSRAVVQIGGSVYRIDASRLQSLKQHSVPVRNLLTRYADCLLAQVLQSVACNALHSIDKRCARWLLTLQDRVGSDVLPITQDMLADILGVQRTYVTRVIQAVKHQGLVVVGRGRVRVVNRAALERASCECYAQVNAHFTKVLGLPVVSNNHAPAPSLVRRVTGPMQAAQDG
jgi:CRP-like cAMP-binding protein